MTFNKRRTEEDDLQIQVARYLDLTGWRWCHAANERKTSARAGGQLKRKGVKRGIPDVLIFEHYTQGTFTSFGIAIELKVQKRKPSAEQKLWLAALNERGWLTAICYSLDEVRDVVSVLRGAL